MAREWDQFISDQAWADICAAAGRAPDNDIEARAELEDLITEYPSLAYNREREAKKIERLARMLKHFEAFATDYRALFPPHKKLGQTFVVERFSPRPKKSSGSVVEDFAGNVLAQFKTLEEAAQWIRCHVDLPCVRIRPLPPSPFPVVVEDRAGNVLARVEDRGGTVLERFKTLEEAEQYIRHHVHMPSTVRIRERELRTSTDDEYDAIELLRQRSTSELRHAQCRRRANARRKSTQREEFYRRLCLAWVNHFHGKLTYNRAPSTKKKKAGPPRGPLIEFILAAFRQVVPEDALPSRETVRDAVAYERRLHKKGVYLPEEEEDHRDIMDYPEYE